MQKKNSVQFFLFLNVTGDSFHKGKKKKILSIVEKCGHVYDNMLL